MQLGKRLGHKKSRNGCLRCKARRVKCDELRPCTNCVRHHVECSLVTSSTAATSACSPPSVQTASVTAAPGSAPAPSSSPLVLALGLREQPGPEPEPERYTSTHRVADEPWACQSPIATQQDHGNISFVQTILVHFSLSQRLPILLHRRSTQLQEPHRNIMRKATRARANVLHETGCRVFNSFTTTPPQSGDHS
ncbi:C6 zinc finger domain-containing protein [Fusarium falciforme]|uniref:C6 zinc finger domain-containing protein n=1 Tax=Fusarium falciforme TaxID=195108 RepID=UPI00230058AF|nr:C6 zinc finger domain-containing protein [Fusarium falciforme]WAO82885.1 C6 zinc finger domain-containing protein [Fusarium falciforme]